MSKTIFLSKNLCFKSWAQKNFGSKKIRIQLKGGGDSLSQSKVINHHILAKCTYKVARGTEDKNYSGSGQRMVIMLSQFNWNLIAYWWNWAWQYARFKFKSVLVTDENWLPGSKWSFEVLIVGMIDSKNLFSKGLGFDLLTDPVDHYGFSRRCRCSLVRG